MKRIVVYLFCFILFVSFLYSSQVMAADPAQNLKGTVRISGAWALYPMMVKWGEEFRKTYPGIRIDISAGGAGKGIADALNGLVDIGMVSRDIRPEEIKPGTTYVPVVKDAVFPTMSMNNPAMKNIAKKGIKKKTFNDLWILGKPLTWGEISGTNTKNSMQVYTRSDSCGAAETWAHYLGKKQEDLKGVGVYGDPGLAEAVKRDVYGVGYNNLNYAYDAKTGLPVAGIQIIPIDVNENGKIDPNEDLSTKEKAIKAVLSGVYPSPPARDLYLITKERFKEPSKTFVQWILTEGQKYVNEVGYIKIAPKQIAESLKKLEK
ncbi:MAG: ABC-type phosphate transport system, periplasmic component [Nitrospirae bacterium]|nr:ABC-type phosphate transport system, periplasmic component [Nitrospirota bacterium]